MFDRTMLSMSLIEPGYFTDAQLLPQPDNAEAIPEARRQPLPVAGAVTTTHHIVIVEGKERRDAR